MKLSELKTALSEMNQVHFYLPNDQQIPEHFHVTEVGLSMKRFIDCGGTLRNETTVNFQLWTSIDYDHRLSASKLKSIIAIAENELLLPNAEIEVEYQGETIGKYGLETVANGFRLTSQQTDCLAKDNCGIPAEKPKVALASVGNNCAPGSGCC